MFTRSPGKSGIQLYLIPIVGQSWNNKYQFLLKILFAKSPSRSEVQPTLGESWNEKSQFLLKILVARSPSRSAFNSTLYRSLVPPGVKSISSSSKLYLPGLLVDLKSNFTLYRFLVNPRRKNVSIS
jgi:hypothetical protein